MRSWKNILILFAVIVFSVLSCSDDQNTSSGNGNIHTIDPTITITDEFGNIIGGDTTDWCISGGGGVVFNPVYPNPTSDTMNLHFTISQPDTLTLYFLNSATDTLFIWKNEAIQPGFYDLKVSSNAIGYNNVVKRLYLNVRTHPGISPYCRYYGDVQFY